MLGLRRLSSTSAIVADMGEQMGIRELRQQASELVRRAGDGEEIVIAVSGYPTARLVPLETRQWRTASELGDRFSTSTDPTWLAELDEPDDPNDEPRDPWERAGL